MTYIDPKLQDLNTELTKKAKEQETEKLNCRTVLSNLPTYTLEDAKLVEEALKVWLERVIMEKKVPTISELAQFSLSPNHIILNKINDLGLDHILQFMADQEKGVLEKQGLDGSGVVAKELLHSKFNISHEGINPLEVKFVPDLKITNYQKTLLKELQAQGLITDIEKCKVVAEQMLNDYALDSGERFPTEKK